MQEFKLNTVVINISYTQLAFVVFFEKRIDDSPSQWDDYVTECKSLLLLFESSFWMLHLTHFFM